MEEPEETFRRAHEEPRLHDPLVELLHKPSDNDWAFFWTHNVSVPRSSFEEIGGFCEDFELKGVEDMEIGLRGPCRMIFLWHGGDAGDLVLCGGDDGAAEAVGGQRRAVGGDRAAAA
ncbi:hypothetical protein AB0I73_28025, partial [Streptomyces sp. NPDC050388]